MALRRLCRRSRMRQPPIFLNLVHTYIHISIYIAPLHAQGTSMPRAHKMVQFLSVDKGTSLPCYYVKMCRTGVTCIFTCSTHFYMIAVKGCSFVEGRMRNCIFCPLSLSRDIS